MSFLDLDDNRAYRQWADSKRANYDLRASDQFTPVIGLDSSAKTDDANLQMIRRQIRQFNFALYRMPPQSDPLPAIKQLGTSMGLCELDKNLCAREDRITCLTVKDQGRANQYIPYTNKAIGWHTDGYYNPMHQRVQAFILHCQQPAASGGVNELLDPDMVYIHLRDRNPDYIRAFSDPAVMCIPENLEDGKLIRPRTCSAVFVREQPDALTMRFSKRKHNIDWAQDELSREALECLFEYLQSSSPYIISYRLDRGEGVISNNVLHTRSAFSDSADNKRVYYRARYYNRMV